jgi:hypothetical protein
VIERTNILAKRLCLSVHIIAAIIPALSRAQRRDKAGTPAYCHERHGAHKAPRSSSLERNGDPSRSEKDEGPSNEQEREERPGANGKCQKNYDLAKVNNGFCLLCTNVFAACVFADLFSVGCHAIVESDGIFRG